MFKKTAVIVAAITALTFAGTANATLLKIDLGNGEGSATDWDVFHWDSGLQKDGHSVTGAVTLTDWSSGGDNDVTLSITGMQGESTTGASGSSPTIDGVTVPEEVGDDYAWGGTDDSSNSIIFEFKNLDAGTYNVSVFEGRNNDDNGQHGTIWVGVFGNKPVGTNTGDFAGSSATVTGLTISDGDSLFYTQHDDGTGGTSGLIVRVVPEPATMSLLALGGLAMIRRRRRA